MIKVSDNLKYHLANIVSITPLAALLMSALYLIINNNEGIWHLVFLLLMWFMLLLCMIFFAMRINLYFWDKYYL